MKMSRTKKLAALPLVAVLVLIAAAWTANYVLTTVNVRIVGPFYTSPQAFDSTNIMQVGGHVNYYLAGDSEKIGQVVYLSSKNTTSKAAVANSPVGVVVGGARTSMQASIAVADTGTLAAIAGQKVIVMDEGRFWVLDSGTGKAPGTHLRPSGTAGRAAGALTAIDSAYRVFGITLDTTLSGKAVLTQIHAK